jgi:hypothetical protein
MQNPMIGNWVRFMHIEKPLADKKAIARAFVGSPTV